MHGTTIADFAAHAHLRTGAGFSARTLEETRLLRQHAHERGVRVMRGKVREGVRQQQLRERRVLLRAALQQPQRRGCREREQRVGQAAHPGLVAAARLAVWRPQAPVLPGAPCTNISKPP